MSLVSLFDIVISGKYYVDSWQGSPLDSAPPLLVYNSDRV